MTADALSKATGIDASFLLISPELREQVEQAMDRAYKRGQKAANAYWNGPPWGEPNDFVKVEPGDSTEEDG
jgi:hypothetical protein